MTWLSAGGSIDTSPPTVTMSLTVRSVLSALNLSVTGPFLVAGLVVYLAYVHHVRFRRIHALHAAYAKKHGLASPRPLTRKDGKAPTREEYPMSPAEAQEIIRLSWASEMPYLLGKALEFALFKVRMVGRDIVPPEMLIGVANGVQFCPPDIRHPFDFAVALEYNGVQGGRQGWAKVRSRVNFESYHCCFQFSLLTRRYVDTSVLIFGFLSYTLTGPGSGAAVTDEPEDPRGALAIARMNWLHGRYQGKIVSGGFGGRSLREWIARSSTRFLAVKRRLPL